MRMQLNPNLARCAVVKADPDIFFMDDKDEPNYNAVKTEIARSICNQCPIQKHCLEFAIKEEMEGVWGGTTTKERNAVIYRQRTGYTPKPRAPKTIKAINAIANANRARTLDAANRDRQLLVTALTRFGDIEPITIQIANLRLDNPDVPLSELASMAGVTKDVFAGRLKRLIKRLENAA